MALEPRIERSLSYQLGALALLISLASIGTALGFEHIGGYQPCMLCYLERHAYYLSLPLLFFALAADAGRRTGWAAAVYFIVALAFLANAGLGTYHAGAEWGFWEGPATCSGAHALTTSAGDLLKTIQVQKVVPCDKASLVFLGLSFAGWNVVASLLLMTLTLRAAFAVSERRAIASVADPLR